MCWSGLIIPDVVLLFSVLVVTEKLQNKVHSGGAVCRCCAAVVHMHAVIYLSPFFVSTRWLSLSYFP